MMGTQSSIKGIYRDFSQRIALLFVLALVVSSGTLIYSEFASNLAEDSRGIENFSISIRESLLKRLDLDIIEKCVAYSKQDRIAQISVTAGDQVICSSNDSKPILSYSLNNKILFSPNSSESAGDVKVKISLDKILYKIAEAVALTLVLFTVLMVFAYRGFGTIERKVIYPIEGFSRLFKRIDDTSVSDTQNSFEVKELNEMNLAFSEMIDRIHSLNDQKIQYEKQKSTLELARQVAHDIRSPLSALNMITNSISGLSEEHKSILQEVSRRVSDIADDLLKQTKNQNDGIVSNNHLPKNDGICFTIQAVQSLVMQKQLEFKNRTDVSIEIRNHGIFEDTKIALSENSFTRILSNLINNSLEAMSENSSIFIELSKNDKACTVSVIDFGKGIPADILAELKKRPLSYGKNTSETSGSGIGVFSASEELKRIGGSLSIESREGVGTKVTLQIPLSL